MPSATFDLWVAPPLPPYTFNVARVPNTPEHQISLCTPSNELCPELTPSHVQGVGPGGDPCAGGNASAHVTVTSFELLPGPASGVTFNFQQQGRR